ALFLLQLENESSRVALHKAAEAFGLGLTLGSGALVGGPASVGAEATTMARLGAAARTGLLWADRIVFAMDVTNSVIQDHRGWIISTWGNSGRAFVNRFEQLNSYVQIFGMVRGAVGLGQLAFHARKALQEWRAARNALQTELSESERAVVQEID